MVADPTPKVAVVIPFYNNDTDIRSCLDSLKISAHPISRIIIVDNCDRPTNIRVIAQDYLNATIVRTNPRIGFAQANCIGANIAIQQGAEYVISLNQDAVVASDCIGELLRAFSTSSDVAIVAPILYDHNFSSIEAFFVRWYATQCPRLLLDALDGSLQATYDMSVVSGACLGIRASFVATFGFFDSIYFMYCEDEDLCRKAKYLGYRIVVVPKARAGHRHSHMNVEGGRRKRIDEWKRKSDAVYILKDVKSSLLRGILRVEYTHLREYVGLLVRLRLQTIVQCLVSDLKLHLSLPRILKSRRTELALIRRWMSEQPK